MSKPLEPSELIRCVVDKVNLKSIYIKSSASDIYITPEGVSSENSKLSINYKFSHQLFDDPRELVCFIHASLISEPKENADLVSVAQDGKLFESACVFVLRYDLEEGEISDGAFEAFTRSNAMFNAYPFIREYMNSSLSKMGIHELFLPLLKIPKISAKPKQGSPSAKVKKK